MTAPPVPTAARIRWDSRPSGSGPAQRAPGCRLLRALGGFARFGNPGHLEVRWRRSIERLWTVRSEEVFEVGGSVRRSPMAPVGWAFFSIPDPPSVCPNAKRFAYENASHKYPITY